MDAVADVRIGTDFLLLKRKVSLRLHTLNKWLMKTWHSVSKALRHFSSRIHCVLLNLLKPTGYVMHQQFNIQQLYALPTLYLCVLYLSENKQRLVPLTA